MNNCIDYIELISASVDSELTDAERTRLEEHLSTCENCSAILALFREMSIAADESSVETPASMCADVMEKILSEGNIASADMAQSTSNQKRNNIRRLALTRYLPAAACLALILFIAPWFMNNFRGQYDTQVAPTAQLQVSSDYAAPEMFAAAMPDAAPDGDVAPDVFGDPGIGRNMEVASGGTEAAPSLAAPAPVALPEALPEIAMEAETDQEHFSRAGDVEDYGSDDDGAGAGDMVSEEDESVTAWGIPPSESNMEVINILDDLVSASYVWIEITGGELPESLLTYESEQLGDWTVWDVSYRIPRDVARTLIAEIEGREGVSVTFVDSDSEYALVLFAHE